MAWLILVAALGSCQWPGSAPAQPSQQIAQAQALRLRIQRLQARLRSIDQPATAAPLLETRAAPGQVSRQAQIPATAESAEGQATAIATEASTKAVLATTLVVNPGEIPKLESGAAWLASLPPRRASSIVMNNWRSTEEQARTIKFFAYMDRAAAAAILEQMPVQLLSYGQSKYHLMVYAPGHHAANQRGYVLVRITGTR